MQSGSAPGRSTAQVRTRHRIAAPGSSSARVSTVSVSHSNRAVVQMLQEDWAAHGECVAR
eukprot:3377107-Rhodomonas_salina.5